MKHVLFAFAAAALLMTSTGCGLCDGLFSFHKHGGACNGCDGGGCGGGCGDGAGCANCGGPNGGCADGAGCANGGGLHGGNGDGGLLHHPPLPRGAGGCYTGPEGPPTGAVAYPYYTTRGPRDFLMNNPPSIGP
jgi:hypothetical protein